MSKEIYSKMKLHLKMTINNDKGSIPSNKFVKIVFVFVFVGVTVNWHLRTRILLILSIFLVFLQTNENSVCKVKDCLLSPVGMILV